MAALTSSAGPFYAKDSAGTMQKIKVVDLPLDIGTTDDDLIAGYAYVEATGSTLDYISGSNEKLITINNTLEDISGSVPVIVEGMNFVTASVDKSTQYVEQILKFQRATNVFSKRYIKQDLFDFTETPIEFDLHMEDGLNPAVSTLDRENYISKAIEVIIQNSTNKNLYLKVSYDPASPLSETEYTIKIPPGVIYNSESKIAHIRHKIIFASDAFSTFVGEVSVSISYNDNLNNDLSIGESTFGQPYVSSIATNFFNMAFNPLTKYLVAEWYFQSGSTPESFNGMTISGQARISNSSTQKLTLYVTNDGGNTIYGVPPKKYEIVDETPTPWSLNYTSIADAPATGRYELIAELSGAGNIGDARILYADLIRRKI